MDFTLSNARRFYSSMGNPLAGGGLTASKTHLRDIACLSFLVIMVNEVVELESSIETASMFAVFPEIRTLLHSNSKSIF